MAVIVTGLSPTPDASGLRDAIVAAGLDAERLHVIEPGEEGAGGVTSSQLGADSRHVALNMGESNDLGTGTGVPGITNYRPVDFPNRADDSDDRLSEFGIADDEIGNYLEALANGRAVVGYFARPENGERAEAVFRANGILNVRRSVR